MLAVAFANRSLLTAQGEDQEQRALLANSFFFIRKANDSPEVPTAEFCVSLWSAFGPTAIHSCKEGLDKIIFQCPCSTLRNTKEEWDRKWVWGEPINVLVSFLG